MYAAHMRMIRELDGTISHVGHDITYKTMKNLGAFFMGELTAGKRKEHSHPWAALKAMASTIASSRGFILDAAVVPSESDAVIIDAHKRTCCSLCMGMNTGMRTGMHAGVMADKAKQLRNQYEQPVAPAVSRALPEFAHDSADTELACGEAAINTAVSELLSNLGCSTWPSKSDVADSYVLGAPAQVARAVISMDIEWDVHADVNSDRVDVVQLAYRAQGSNSLKVLCCQLDGGCVVPAQLSALLQSNDVLFVGKSIKGDVRRLVKHMEGTSESDILCKDLAKICVEQRKTARADLGLAEIAAAVLGYHLPKPEDIRKSQWSLELDAEQIAYAARDAACGLLIYEKSGADGSIPMADSDHMGMLPPELPARRDGVDRCQILRDNFTRIIFTDKAHSDAAKGGSKFKAAIREVIHEFWPEVSETELDQYLEGVLIVQDLWHAMRRMKLAMCTRHPDFKAAYGEYRYCCLLVYTYAY